MIVAVAFICVGAAVIVIGAVMSRDTEGVEPMSWRAMERYREAEHEDETVE